MRMERNEAHNRDVRAVDRVQRLAHEESRLPTSTLGARGSRIRETAHPLSTKSRAIDITALA